MPNSNPKGNPKGQPRGQNRPRNRMMQRATSNVQLQDQGQVDLLNQQMQQAQQDYQREQQSRRSIYGGYQDTLANVPRPQFGQIGQDFNAGLSSVAPMFGGDPYMPQGEQDAGNALGLATGEAGHTMLANLAAREGMARSSAGREGGLASRYAGDNLLQKFQDTMQGYNNNLGQVRADDPWQIQQEASRLKEQMITQQLARARMKSDAATAAFLEQYYGGLVGGPGGNPGGHPAGHVRPASTGPASPNYGNRTPPRPGMEPIGQGTVGSPAAPGAAPSTQSYGGYSAPYAGPEGGFAQGQVYDPLDPNYVGAYPAQTYNMPNGYYNLPEQPAGGYAPAWGY